MQSTKTDANSLSLSLSLSSIPTPATIMHQLVWLPRNKIIKGKKKCLPMTNLSPNGEKSNFLLLNETEH